MSKTKAPLITMSAAVSALGLRIAGDGSELIPTDVTDINIMCPECASQHSSRRLTMNINFETNVFGCMRCNFNGGVHKLVSYYTGWPIDEVPDRIRNGELGTVNAQAGKDHEVSKIESVQMLAPLKQRHDVYSAMLDLLPLYPVHKKDLICRGLSESTIEGIGFKSYPKYMDPTVIARKLTEAGLDLRGVPGFGINAKGNRCMATLADGGYLIPVRNGSGLIQGFQIRFDHPSDSIPKYGYFTSSKMSGGAKCGTWCAWAGEELEKREDKSPFDVILIEGPLKAYIVNEITGCNVIAVPGVSALKRVPGALQQMVHMGLKTVYIAYDMDSEDNEAVAMQLNRLREILHSLNIKSKTLVWDKDCKGLDDWVTSHHFKDL